MVWIGGLQLRKVLKYEHNNQNNRRTNMIFADKLILLRKKQVGRKRNWLTK
jgi:hypothetical protein